MTSQIATTTKITRITRASRARDDGGVFTSVDDVRGLGLPPRPHTTNGPRTDRPFQDDIGRGPDEKGRIRGWHSWLLNRTTALVIDKKEHPCSSIVRIPALGACPFRPAVSTAPLQRGVATFYATDDHAASALADEARFVGELLSLRTRGRESSIHRRNHKRV